MRPACLEVKVEGAESGKFRVEKIRFGKTDAGTVDKSIIEYNPWIRLTGIPQEAYEYVVNGHPAIEWIMERYQVRTDKPNGITNDPNDWAPEQGKPRYILDLLLSIISVSLETLRRVRELPQLTCQEAGGKQGDNVYQGWPAFQRGGKGVVQGGKQRLEEAGFVVVWPGEHIRRHGMGNRLCLRKGHPRHRHPYQLPQCGRHRSQFRERYD